MLVVNTFFCLEGIFDLCLSQLPILEETVLVSSIILSGSLITCHFQTVHQGRNYAEQLKTEYCHNDGVVCSVAMADDARHHC